MNISLKDNIGQMKDKMAKRINTCLQKHLVIIIIR